MTRQYVHSSLNEATNAALALDVRSWTSSCARRKGPQSWLATTISCIGSVVAGAMPSACAAPPQTRPTSVVGYLQPSVIQGEVRRHYANFRGCYQWGLSIDPNMTGRVTARFVIGRDGSVSNVSNAGSDFPNVRVITCILVQFYKIKFPAPDGGIVTVVYPIMLKPSP